MKILKRILLAIAIIIGIALIVALFTKKEYKVEREVTISKPKNEVFNYVKYLKNQNKFNVWALADPKMRTEFKGTDGTVGFVSAWNSELDDVGQGEQTIAKIDEGNKIDYNLHFVRPMESKAYSYMTTETVNDQTTKVKWGMQSKMAYPFNLMLVIFSIDKMLGDDMQTSLNSLKNQMETTNQSL